MSMYKTLSLQGEPIYCYPVALPLWVCTNHCLYKVNHILLSCSTNLVEYVQNIVSTRGTIILLSCSTTFVIMYKTLSLQCEQYIVILQHDTLWVCTIHCLYKVNNILLSCSTTFVSMYKTLSQQWWTIYCYPVARHLWVYTKHWLCKVNNILLSCSTTFVSMYKTLSLQGEQYNVIL